MQPMVNNVMQMGTMLTAISTRSATIAIRISDSMIIYINLLIIIGFWFFNVLQWWENDTRKYLS